MWENTQNNIYRSLERLVEPLEKAGEIIEQASKDEFETEQPANGKGQSEREKSSDG